MIWFVVLIFVSTVIAIVVTWLQWNYDHWKKRGIPQVEPTLIFGNIKDALIGGHSLAILNQKIYDAFPGEPIIGFYQLRKPALLIKEPELVKAVLVSEFQNFRDTGKDVSKEVDPIVGRNPFFIKGDAWKEARRIQSRYHSSTKLKKLFVSADGVKDEFIQHINKNLNRKFDARDLCSRFTMDVVSSCVFGMTWSHASEDSQFRHHLVKMLETRWQLLLWTADSTLINKLKIPIFPKEYLDFFCNFVKELVDLRRKSNIFRADLLQNLLSDKNEHLSMVDVTAQMMTFVVDGYTTSATEMSFLIYMLAIHPDVQENLREEINSTENLDYETIHQLPYLEAVFNETLRLFPAVDTLSRQCNQDTTITVNKKKFEFKAGDTIEVPVYSIHRDSTHFPDPLKFDPYRFLDNPNHPAFLAFGAGPRACPGIKFAKTQVKVGVANLIKCFRILPGTEDHSLPTVENNKTVVMTSDKLMTVRFVKL